MAQLGAHRALLTRGSLALLLLVAFSFYSYASLPQPTLASHSVAPAIEDSQLSDLTEQVRAIKENLERGQGSKEVSAHGDPAPQEVEPPAVYDQEVGAAAMRRAAPEPRKPRSAPPVQASADPDALPRGEPATVPLSLLRTATQAFPPPPAAPPPPLPPSLSESTPTAPPTYEWYELAARDKRVGRREGGYLPCPSWGRGKKHAADMSGLTDEEYVVRRINEAPTVSKPFRTIIYMCNVLPPSLYDGIESSFWPSRYMATDRKKGTGTYVAQHHRHQLSFELLLRLNLTHPGIAADWPGFHDAAASWTRLKSVLHSPKVERALFKKLGVPYRYKARDFRVQADREGFGVGIHPDRPTKLVTFQFYLPSLQENPAEAMFRYGTMVHSVEQFEKRNSKTGQNKWYNKMLFLPNAAYAFAVHPTSYHAVDTRGSGGKLGVRRSFMLNWYNDGKAKGKYTGR